MEFRILGPVEVVDADRRLDLGGLRERTLLAALVLSANRVVSADRLAEQLWSGEPPPHSMATLRVYVSRLRRALGAAAGALVTQPPGYRLMVQAEQLDALRFERLADAARGDLAAGRPEQAAQGLRRALELWRGPALADVADLAFAQADAARLEEARLTAIEDRVEADLRCGRHPGLVAELDALIAAAPLRERLCGQRMIALYRCGRQADALRGYQDLRTRLAEELGIDPSPQLRLLQQSVLRQDPGLAWQPPPAERPAPADQQTEQETRPTTPQTTPQTIRQPARQLTPADPVADLLAKPPAQPPVELPAQPPVEPLAEPSAGIELPAETTSFIGREAELRTIAEVLGLSRLLTLTGPSGSGKSRLALRAATQLAPRFPGGVRLVELAPVLRPELVLPALAALVTVREQRDRSLLDSAIAALRDRECLLILDNCEHVLDAAAELAEALLRSCPQLRIIATSQGRLHVSGEATWPVPPLSLPDPQAHAPAVLAEAESVRLFCDRAALSRPGFALSPDNAPPVAEICRRLDGIPLAIELAAARINTLTPAQLAARLSDRFRLLTSGSRVGLPRHRTLAAAIEWSHDLLSEPERICLRRLAVFAGGCSLEAAEAVCPDEQLPRYAVFEAIAALVDRSLLTTDERSGTMRYRMLESIHFDAAQRLDRAGERAALERRHRDWLLDHTARADLDGPDQSAWLDLLDADQDNLRAGLQRCLADGDAAAALALTGALAPFWAVRGHIQEGRRWLDAALAAAGPDPDPDRRLLATALSGAAMLASVHADTQAQLGYLEHSLALWRELDDPLGLARCLGDLGAAAHIRGDYAAALAHYAEALELSRQAADGHMAARALSGLARVALHQGRHQEAVLRYQESLTGFRQAGDLRQATLVLGNLGVLAYLQGDLDLSRARLEEHLANARRLGDRKLIGGALTNLGLVDFEKADHDRAAVVHAEALDLAEQIGDRRLAAVALSNLGLVALARKELPLARSYLLRSMDLAVAMGERRAVAESLEELAKVEAAEGAATRAAVLIGASTALRESIGAPAGGPDLVRLDRSVAAISAALGEPEFRARRDAGRALSLAEAVRFARENGSTAVFSDLAAAAGNPAAAASNPVAPGGDPAGTLGGPL